MKKTDSKAIELINKANSILASISKKDNISEHEKNIKTKYGKDPKHQEKIKLQLKYLKEERIKRNNEARNKYSRWFDECNGFVNRLDNKKYNVLIEKTKENLDVRTKINSMIKIIKKINENLEKDNYIELHLDREVVYKKIMDIIKEGENDKVEFKSSLRWDWNNNSLNKSLEIVINKAISAFMNSNGGILLIGVSDDEKILGIEKDYPTLRKQDGDGFIQFLVQVMHNRLGKEFSQYISANIRNVDGKDICIINVKQSQNPVFVKYDNKEEFYIRASATSQPLNVREAMEYMQMHWAKK